MSETQNTLYLVFTSAMPGKEVEFDRWYAAHVQQILAVDGFESARRMAPTEISGRPAPEHGHLVAYEIAGDPAAAFARLKDAAVAGKVSRPDPDLVVLPLTSAVYSQIG